MLYEYIEQTEEEINQALTYLNPQKGNGGFLGEKESELNKTFTENIAGQDIPLLEKDEINSVKDVSEEQKQAYIYLKNIKWAMDKLFHDSRKVETAEDLRRLLETVIVATQEQAQAKALLNAYLEKFHSESKKDVITEEGDATAAPKSIIEEAPLTIEEVSDQSISEKSTEPAELNDITKFKRMWEEHLNNSELAKKLQIECKETPLKGFSVTFMNPGSKKKKNSLILMKKDAVH